MNIQSYFTCQGTTCCPSCKSENWKTAKLVVMENTYSSSEGRDLRSLLYSDKWFKEDLPLDVSESSSALAHEIKKMTLMHATIAIPPNEPVKAKAAISLPPPKPKLTKIKPEYPKNPKEPPRPQFNEEMRPSPPPLPNTKEINEKIQNLQENLDRLNKNGPIILPWYDSFISSTAAFGVVISIIVVTVMYTTSLPWTIISWQFSLSCLALGWLSASGSKNTAIKDHEKESKKIMDDIKDQEDDHRSVLSKYQSSKNSHIVAQKKFYKDKQTIQEAYDKAIESYKQDQVLFQEKLAKHNYELKKYESYLEEHEKTLATHDKEMEVWSEHRYRENIYIDNEHNKALTIHKEQKIQAYKFRELLWENARVCMRCGLSYIGRSS